MSHSCQKFAAGRGMLDAVLPDRDLCVAAVASRDARFDGRFFTAVSSTGIYCRPSCPAMTPREHHLTFYPSAAAAQEAGYRACRRCRPDAVPGSPDWDVRADAIARAVRLIGDGLVDREGVPAVAARVGYSVRQLQRLTLAIGPWTVELVAMRSLGDPDAFPATDLGVRRALARLGLTPADAERWRPWRAYATQHLWATLDHPINHLPEDPR